MPQPDNLRLVTDATLHAQLDGEFNERGAVLSSTVRRIVTLTQIEYDALATPDVTTLYVVIG